MARITLIGSGNVATQLGLGLAKAGHTIETVYSRTKEHAAALATLLNGTIAPDTDFRQSQSELFIVAVNDQSIETLVQAVLLPPQAIIAHTSGSVAMQVLHQFPRHGVFYPLQTFTKGKEINFTEVPFGIEASEEETYRTLAAIASTLSPHVQSISSAQRKILHVAAVFACNFTNYLLSVSETILEKENLDFGLMKPLVDETIRKAFAIGPDKAQTGPAFRGDEVIMQQHLHYLQTQPVFQQLYKQLSEGIQYQKKSQ